MTTVSIVTSGHFSTSPRVVKEADALAAAGFDVEVFGVKFDPVQAELDAALMPRLWRFTPVADLTPTTRNRWDRFYFRARRKIGDLLGRRLYADPHALGFAMHRMLERTAARNARLTIVHLEPALWIGCRLMNRGLAVGVDMEDWYSEGTTWRNATRIRRKIVDLERTVLTNAPHRTTTSNAMAKALVDAYGVPELKVVYNSTPSGGEVAAAPKGDLRLFWFSQTVGRGRGLELLFDALASIEGGWSLTILGRSSTGMREFLLERLPSATRERVSFLNYIPPGDLQRETTRHDVGLALETASCLNHQYTTSNKIFQYLQAGLHVIATATAGHCEVVRELPNHGCTFQVGDKAALKALICEIIGRKDDIRRNRRQCATAADARFGYEHSARVLVNSVKAAVA